MPAHIYTHNFLQWLALTHVHTMLIHKFTYYSSSIYSFSLVEMKTALSGK